MHETKSCQNCKQDFALDDSDLGFLKANNLPPPTFCPNCRLQRRLAFRNERTLYKRTCGLCGKSIVTIYAPDKDLTVYCQPCFWSDKWDPLEYGREYDFSRTLFEQWRELRARVPIPAMNTLYQTLVNSDYTNQVGHLKNCYLLFNSDYSENCAYGSEVENSRDAFDNVSIAECTLCYECVNCESCYKTFYSEDCESCHGVWFSKNLSGCSDCFGCVNLRKQKFCLFNEQLSEEEYRKRLAEMTKDSASLISYGQKARELWNKYPVKFAHERQNANCTGEYISNCRDVKDSYLVTQSQNCRYAMWLVAPNSKDCWDYTEYGDSAERVYDSINVGMNVSEIKFCNFAFSSLARMEYSAFCFSSSDLFGCVSLRSNQFCILNRKYSPEEYAGLVAKIKKQMVDVPYRDACGREYRYGEFFPIELSLFGYNETSAEEYFPLTREEAEKEGYNWKESEGRNYKIDLGPADLPLRADLAEESILGVVIGCAASGTDDAAHNCATAFKILPQELAFLKQQELPLPTKCFSCRQIARIKRRNSVHFRKAACECAGHESGRGGYANQNLAAHQHGEGVCAEKFQTTYPADHPAPIYCDKCYKGEVM